MIHKQFHVQVCSVPSSRGMMQIKGMELISGVELTLGRCLIAVQGRKQFKGKRSSLGWKKKSQKDSKNCGSDHINNLGHS